MQLFVGSTSLPARRGRWIYALCETSGEVRYVGKCDGGYVRSRYKTHLREAIRDVTHNHRLSWIRSLLAKGDAPLCRVLEEVEIGLDLAQIEQQWIALLRSIGCRLVNTTDGGEGMKNPSDETRAKLRARPQVGFDSAARAAAATARRIAAQSRRDDPTWQSEQTIRAAERRKRRTRLARARYVGANVTAAREDIEAHGNAGVAKSSEHRAKLAEATRRHIAQHGHARAGRSASDETREKMRAAWVRRKARAQGGDAQ